MNTTLLASLAAKFAQVLPSPDLQEHIGSHAQRVVRANRLLTGEKIPTLTKDDLRELFFDSDSFNFWGNKEWPLNDRLQKFGLDGICHVLLELVTRGERGLTVTDMRALLDMRGLGVLLTTELLAYRFPTRYWTYSSNVTLPAFAALGEDVKATMPHGQKSDAFMYMALQPLLDQVSAALQAAGVAKTDYLFLDIFLWWVTEQSTISPIVPVVSTPIVPPTPSSAAILATLRGAMDQAGLSYTDLQLVTLYTALQTKPFVILSGISGTGKTKLVQTFAAIFPQPVESALETDSDRISVTVQPYMLKYGRLIVPKSATRLFDPPAPGKQIEVTLTFDGQSQTCRLVHASYGDNDYLSLLLRGTAKQWFNKTLVVGAVLNLEPELGSDENLKGFRLYTQVAPGNTLIPTKTGQNWLFMPVRPDWRDSKSLLGYYNPLTGAYEWTAFLRFLLRVTQSYQAQDGLAWFVILDEMNLAHVEYYFADLLSVLESGRDAVGWTREPLRITYPDGADGDLPPREIKLPPNLYVVGTVNVDETTHAFSPKVLDRAFTLELTDADFTTYLTTAAPASPTAPPIDPQQMLARFTGQGSFTGCGSADKSRMVAYLAAHPEVRAYLQTLNLMFQPFGFHFGFRVFDELVWFLYWAGINELFTSLGGIDTALDTALLLKVLPKFYGSRSRLEAPLQALLAWCLDPVAPSESTIADTVQQAEGQLDEAFSQLKYRYPRTAERAWRILQALYVDGFAAFG